MTTPTISIHPPEPAHITLDVFFADERPDLAVLYCAGQAESLRRHLGDREALRPDDLGDACVVLARDRDGRPHGGMRVHVRRPGHPLPVERALGGYCPIGEAVERAPGPLVELCGTWISADHRGSELAAAVTRTALGVARALGARRLVGCAHQHVLDFYRRFGAVVDEALGVHPYPDARYQTCVFWADPTGHAEGREAIDAQLAGLRRRAAGPATRPICPGEPGIRKLIRETNILVSERGAWR